ncbi:MAG: NUDIX pyrophosphatase [Chlorobiaceae bacterium]|nr:NUDIX pyrophosphatase [Chlorobiaceae bacterium]
MSKISSSIVEVCVFKKENSQVKYLLLHRTADEKVYPNLWQFITGSIEGNEKAKEAAIRELAEETGLKPESLWVVPYVLSFYNVEWDSVNLCPFFAVKVDSDSSIQISDEHDDFGWFSYDEAIQKLVWPSWREGLRIVNEYITRDRDSHTDIHRIF